MVENHKHSRSRRWFLGAAGGAGIATLAGCTGGNGNGSGNGNGNGNGGNGNGGSDRENRLVFAQNAAPDELDPINNRGGNYSIVIKNWVYDALYTYDEGTDLVPLLATSMPEVNDDGTEFTIEIDSNARWHDGEPVTAADVAYTFTQPVEESTDYGPDFALITSMDEIDEQTIQLNLDEPYPPIMNTIAHPIAPQHVREEDREEFGRSVVVGSGPFEFVEWSAGNYTRLRRHDDYWGDSVPNIEELEFVPIEEDTTRITEFQNDEVNVADNISPDLWGTVENMDDASIVTGPELNYQFAAFNMNEGEVAKQEVREAIVYATDLDSAISNFVEPVGSRMYSILPEPLAEDWDMPLDTWRDMWPEQDIDRARELFESAGVPDDWECNIIVSSTSMRENVAISIANGINEAGYTGTVRRLDFGTMLETFNSGDADQVNIYLLGWTRDPDPDRFIYELVHPEGAFQGTYYDNDEFAQLLDDARVNPNYEERRDMYEEAVTMMIEDRVHIPLYNLSTNMAVKDYVTGLEPHPVATENPQVFSDRRSTNSDSSGTNVSID
ncbi:ABC transporter substrate-binding protein [Halorubraceae archaeon YAN]|nr:ABC transporter substrate-binding protein [Halorubraceae archaeon YAN]